MPISEEQWAAQYAEYNRVVRAMAEAQETPPTTNEGREMPQQVVPWDTLPAGFRWIAHPNEYGRGHEGVLEMRRQYAALENPGPQQALYADRVESLFAWARASGVFLLQRPSRTQAFVFRDTPVGMVVEWRAQSERNWNTNYGVGAHDAAREVQPVCIECGETTHVGDVQCRECGTLNFCPSCRQIGGNAEQSPEGHWWCENCAARCTCGALTSPVHTYCNECATHETCSSCRVVVETLTAQVEEGPFESIEAEDDVGPSPVDPGDPPLVTFTLPTPGIEPAHRLNTSAPAPQRPRPRRRAGQPRIAAPTITMTTLNNRLVCSVCAVRFCVPCGRISEYPLTYAVTTEQLVCRNCFRSEMGRADEEHDEDGGEVMDIRPIPGRESIRMCGIEIEGANGTDNGGFVARRLYRAGLTPVSDIQSWHHGQGFARVETDSTVDWELILGPVNPAADEDMDRVRTAMTIVRDAVHEGRVTLDLRCGLHIHVGAERVGLKSAFNLNTIYSYLEDLIYRLGAARWPIHRSIQQTTQYCQPVQKFEKKLEFGQWHERAGRDGHYYGLSFFNYFQRIFNNCTCGAIRFDSWESCTCDLGKCTFEFRVFNTTANARKLHAYLALCQALVAKAITMPEIENPAEDFPPMGFIERPFKMVEEPERMVEQWMERLVWMFRELPLTEDERMSLLYCIRHSELKHVGDEVLRELSEITTQEVPA